MVDPRDPQSPPDPSETHPDVTAWLQSAPPPAMPAEVSQRLHAALRQEAEQREESAADTGIAAASEAPRTPESTAVVVPLRRRWIKPVLAAAVVLGVIGIAVPVVNEIAPNDPDSSSAGSAISDDDAETSDAREDPSAAQESLPADGTLAAPSERAVLVLSRDGFGAEVARKLNAEVPMTQSLEALADMAPVRCAGGRPTATTGTPVSLDGDPAVLVTAKRPRGLRVQAYVCVAGEPRAAASTLLRR